MGGVFALFDLDDTLIDRAAAFRRWAVTFCDARDLGPAGVEFLCQADGRGYTARPEMFASACAHFDLAEEVDVLVDAYRHDYLSHFEVEAPVHEALRRLRDEGWRIAVVTNGPPSQQEKVDRAGLGSLVDAVCVSEVVGSWKPDPAIFTEALRRIGADGGRPGERWMVGDSPANDIGGGRQLGLRTVWIDRDQEWPDLQFEPDHRVPDVPAAVEVVLSQTA